LNGQSCHPNSLDVKSIKAIDTDNNISWELRNHEVYINTECTQNDKLLIHLSGTFGNPINTTYFPSLAANNGYRVLNLKYPNNVPATTTCDNNNNIDCFKNFRHEIIFGTDESSDVDVDEYNCIINRTEKLLSYLINNFPSENWSDFTLANGKINWSKVVVSGHSQGGGHAAYIAKQFSVDRVLMFASPNDYNSYYSSAANWVSLPGQTAESNYFGFAHLHDNVVDSYKQFAVYNDLNLYAEVDSVLVDNNCNYNNAQVLYSKDESDPNTTNHGCVVVDDQTTFINGIPLYTDVWKYMLDIPQSSKGGYIDQWQNYDNSMQLGLGDREIEWNFDGLRKIDTVPETGVHPRVFFGPSEIPDLIDRMKNTTSGQHVSAQIHAFTTLLHLGYGNGGSYNHNASYAQDAFGNRYIDNAGKWNGNPEYYKLIAKDPTVWDGLDIKRRHITASLMALEALEIMVNNGEIDSDTGLSYSERSTMLAKAMSFWAELAINDPNVNPNQYNNFGGTHMALAYDIHYNSMTTGQQDSVRMGLAKINKDYPLHGGELDAYAATSNWAGLNSFEMMINLAIEGETGYFPQMTEKWARAYHTFINYGWYDSGAGYEGLGKNYMFLTTGIALAKRGYSMLAHPHVKAYGTQFLPAITQPYGHGFTSYDVWGGSGNHPVTGGYKFNASDVLGLKWIYPEDEKIDFVWRNYIEKAQNLSSEGYVYQQVNLDDSYHNYLLLAAIFCQDYNEDSSWNDQANQLVEEDFLAEDRGLAVMRSGKDSLDLAVQFHCRQDMGGHTHGDRNDFTLSALGRVWIRKSYGGSQFQPSWFHSCVLVDDIAIGVGDPDGDKCRQPGKLLEWYPDNQLTKVAGDATDAYTWEWHWSPQSPENDHPWLGANGWEEVTETWNDYQFIPQEEAHFDIPFYDYAHWHQEGKLERMIKREYNSMEKVFRTVGVFKNEKPFVLVTDDIKKDGSTHNYKWLGQIARDLTIESTDVNLVDSDYRADIILKEPDATGNRRLLVRVLENSGYDGSTPPGYQDTLVYTDYFNGNPYNSNPNWVRPRLIIESNSVSPDYKVLLFPYELGENLPTTIWNQSHDTLTVNVGTETTKIAFDVNPDGRTEFGLVGDCGLVTNTNDSGLGSLRSVIDCTSPGDTVRFSIALRNQEINLESSGILINKNIALEADPEENITVKTNNPTSEIAHTVSIETGNTVSLIGLNIIGGNGPLGTAIYNEGTLNIKDIIASKGLGNMINSTVENKGILNVTGKCDIE